MSSSFDGAFGVHGTSRVGRKAITAAAALVLLAAPPSFAALPAAAAAPTGVDSPESLQRLQREVEQARQSPHGLPLVQQAVVRFDPVRDTRHVLLRGNRALSAHASQLARSGTQVLRCRYGPSDLWPDGTPRYEELRFWHGHAPARIGALVEIDQEGALGQLGGATALSACPATDRLPKPHEELRKEVSRPAIH